MRAALGSLLALLAAAAHAAPTTEQLHWLAGCWAAVGGEPGSGEQWMAPAGGSMLGTSRTLRRGALREFEFLHVRDTPQGLVLVALPNSQKQAQFAAEKVDTLDARIEGQRNGQRRVIRFPMKRAACPLGAKP